ncbi:MAG: TetR family transcriptional regulator C-terminal domain-containing protein [Cytophagaceae bacterium]|jgi:AcrR family transcriptional regulator|nr:TetR family transcriptional regulator C-terminal domain-containing protein [Cytophagaceae bacterium]
MDKSTIKKTYIRCWQEKNQRPSLYQLCLELQLEEASFYQYYTTLDAIDKDIWLGVFESTLQQLQQDATYQQYGAREKLLAFYFLWVQKLREHRSFFLLQRDSISWKNIGKNTLDKFHQAFTDYARTLIKQAEEGNEIKARKYLSDQYPNGFWLQALFVLNYWLKDESENFELTDAAIEKAVNLSFQLLGETMLDGLLDFGKFLITKK